LTDTDGSETLSLTITGIPDGVTLSAGTPSDDGSSWSLTPDQLSGFKALKSDGFSAEEDLTLTVTATTTELDGGDSTSVSSTLEVTVEDIADPPTLDLDAVIAGEQLEGAASGLEDAAILLDIRAELNDPLETMSITISNVPEGATLSAGDPVTNPDGTTTWTLTQDDLNGLTITPAPNSDADFDLSVTATSIDGIDSFDVSGTISVDVTGVADAASLNLDAAGDGDPSAGTGATSIPLDISAGLTDTDGSETLSITISGVPAGATLSAGTYNSATDTWTVNQADLGSLSVDSVNGIDDDFTLTVTATTTEIDL